MRRRFRNLYPHEVHGLKEAMRWKFSTIGLKLDSFRPPTLQTLSESFSPAQNSITWIGHASFLIKVEGKTFLLDPVFSDFCAPIPFRRLRRRVPPGLPWDALVSAEAVIITHNHYDHLDRRTIERLPEDMPFLVPEGLAPWFKKLGRENVRQFNWWDSDRLADLELTCVPAQHFSSRTLWDRDQTLWSGWILKTPTTTLYITGDTGYCPVFKEIGNRFGPMDLAIIPIGAYEPRWFMKPMHVTPEEAVKIHWDVRSRQSVASHWGTFCLTDEPMDEPPKRLREALAAAHLNEQQFRVLKIGESIRF